MQTTFNSLLRTFLIIFASATHLCHAVKLGFACTRSKGPACILPPNAGAARACIAGAALKCKACRKLTHNGLDEAGRKVVEKRHDMPPLNCSKRADKCAELSSHRELIVWQAHWPLNFAETLLRIGVLAKFVIDPNTTDILINVPDISINAPLLHFYVDLLAPFGRILPFKTAATGIGSEVDGYKSVVMCCAPDLQPKMLSFLRNGVVEHYLPASAGVDPVTSPGKGQLRVLFIERADSRRLAGGKQLLDACRLAAGVDECTEIVPGLPGILFSDVVRSVRAADVIIGRHGAGMANVAFARVRTAVVEVFPQSFGRRMVPHGWGNKLHHISDEIGLIRRVLLVPEMSKRCAKSKNTKELRDCELRLLEWTDIARALKTLPAAKGGPEYITARGIVGVDQIRRPHR